MHNGMLCDREYEWSRRLKEMCAIRKRTDDQDRQIERLGYYGSLYMAPDDSGPCLTSAMLQAAIVHGAKKSRMGAAAKSGVFVDSEWSPLEYKGPRDRESLYDDKNFVSRATVRVQSSRIVRVRPMFRDWACSFSVIVDPEAISERQVKDAITACGQLCGIGDWRPTYGRFVLDAFTK